MVRNWVSGTFQCVNMKLMMEPEENSRAQNAVAECKKEKRIASAQKH